MLAIVVGVGAVAAGATLITQRVAADDGSTLRTGVASSQTVSETYNAVAAIEPVTRSQVAFPVSGTVNAVNVAVGDTVQIGDALATIDTTELEQALRQAESTLASAQLTLNVALSGEDPSTAGGSSLGGGGGAMMGAAFSGGGAVMDAAFSGDAEFEYASTNPDTYSYQLVAIDDDELAAARQAIVTAQSAVTAATNTVAAARDSAISICAALDVTVDPVDPEGSVAAINANLGACQAAIDQLIAAQDDVTAAQDALAVAADAYDTLLDTWAAELGDSTTSTTSPESPTSTTENPSATTTDDGTATSIAEETRTRHPRRRVADRRVGARQVVARSPEAGAPAEARAVETREPTSAELIAYQADYAAALHAVEAAQQALTQAAIVSPIGGTVVSVGLTTGDSVSAASDTQAIVIEGEGGYEATLSVSVDDIDQITVGQQAQLTPDGGATPETGEVVGISQVPDTSGGTANYRVTVALTSQAADLTSGNVGDVAHRRRQRHRRRRRAHLGSDAHRQRLHRRHHRRLRCGANRASPSRCHRPGVDRDPQQSGARPDRRPRRPRRTAPRLRDRRVQHPDQHRRLPRRRLSRGGGGFPGGGFPDGE